MILFLTTNDHVNLLDFMELPIKRMVGSFLLHQFVVHDMRSFSHCSHLILDREAVAEGDGELVEAIEEFLIMYNARVTVICQGLQPDGALFRGLLDIGVGNIVTASTMEEIRSEICEACSDQGMTRYAAKERPRPAGVYQFNASNVQIAVFGSHPRMGATTAALGLTCWLLSAGAGACYVEDNPSGHLALLAEVYQMAPVGRGYLYRDAPFLTGGAPEGDVNFIVRDMGSGIRETVQAADMAVLCGGAKPYELPGTIDTLRQMAGRPVTLLLPFVAEVLRPKYRELFAGDGRGVVFLDYQPDPMEPEANKQAYLDIVKPYLAGA